MKKTTIYLLIITNFHINMTRKIPMVGIKSQVCLGQLDECGRNQNFVTKNTLSKLFLHIQSPFYPHLVASISLEYRDLS